MFEHLHPGAASGGSQAQGVVEAVEMPAAGIEQGGVKRRRDGSAGLACRHQARVVIGHHGLERLNFGFEGPDFLALDGAKQVSGQSQVAID
jgi:hypothetical protein